MRRQPAMMDTVAVVTGASSGIGAATARELGRRRATVILTARRVRELEAQAEAIRSDGGQAVVIPTDVADPAQVERLANAAIAAVGRVDVLVNCAGANWLRPFTMTSADEIAELVRVNLLGAILLTRAVLPGMLERGRGAIISVGSVQSRVAVEPVYSATKFGLRGFSLALRRQLAGSGVSVSLVLPGNIHTAMTSHLSEPMPGPDIVARVIADLVTHPRREVIVPRKYYATVWVDQLLPDLADLVYRRRHRSDGRERVGENNLASRRQ